MFFTIVLWVALHFAGMSWFDALCYAMGSISLGGVTTHSDGLAFFNSPLIESIIMLGIIIGGMNFANHYFAFANRSLAHYWRDSEIKFTLYALFFTIVVGTIYLWLTKYYGFLGIAAICGLHHRVHRLGHRLFHRRFWHLAFGVVAVDHFIVQLLV